MVDEMRMMKGLRHSGVKEEFAHVTAVAGRALARQGRKDRGERYDNGPLRPTPAQAGMLLRRGWFGRLREGFVPNVVMFWDPWKVGGSLTFRQCAKCRNVGAGKRNG